MAKNPIKIEYEKTGPKLTYEQFNQIIQSGGYMMVFTSFHPTEKCQCGCGAPQMIVETRTDMQKEEVVALLEVVSRGMVGIGLNQN